jgi:broad specificity phosphatase PhoE
MIYIVRHGQTNWNLEHRIQGGTDIELNETGILQAQEIANLLKDKKFDMIFTSPLKRAYKTAEIICNGNSEIIVDDRIRERGNGDFEGKLKEECVKLIDFRDPNENRYNIETVPNCRKRINEFFDYIVKTYPNKEILVVTHAVASIYMRCYFEGEPKDGNYNSYKLKNCEMLKYENYKE